MEAPGKGSHLFSFLISVAFSIAFVAGIAFLIVYWTSSKTTGLGITLAISLAGLGVGLVVWAHRLIFQQEASGTREPLASSDSERQAFLDDFTGGEHRIERRRLLGWMTGIVMATLGVGFISLIRSLGKPPLPVLEKPVWTRGMRLVAYNGQPVSVDTLQTGSVLIVFPEGHTGSIISQALLVRVKEQELKLPPGRADWTPKGNVAYSRICTHAGCSVGLYEADLNLLLCPCHQSTYDVLRGARPTAGPAARPLPQLPLYIDDEGYLRAGGNFSEPPGPGFWSMQ